MVVGNLTDKIVTLFMRLWSNRLNYPLLLNTAHGPREISVLGEMVGRSMDAFQWSSMGKKQVKTKDELS